MKHILLLLCFISTFACAQTVVIPQPREIHFADSTGLFEFRKDLRSAEKLMKQTINSKYDSLIGDEGYRISIQKSGIEISANTQRGLYYGIQSLPAMQASRPADNINTYFRYGTVVDYPTYSYRGMHLDVCRHFFPKETVKKFIDEMAQRKMNYFHWHLTDDQGWRIEIKKYPKLTETGAWRIEKDGSKYDGYYTQDDIKEIVAYAAERYITIIPEIEMPGHSSAAVAAYPWLSCAGNNIAVPNTWGIKKDIYCPTDSTFQFLKDVLDEVCQLFPSRLIHIGGDEVPKAQWKQSPVVKQLQEKEKLKNTEEVQHYFMKQMETYLAAKGKRCIGWGEVVRGGLTDSMVVMSWRGKAAGVKAATNGNNVIMAPRFSCYFDYPQNIKDKKHAWWMTYIPLKKVYHFKPAVRSLALNNKIIGGEATLWTEYVTDEATLWHQLKPRISAMAEALWGTNNNWKAFKTRVKK